MRRLVTSVPLTGLAIAIALGACGLCWAQSGSYSEESIPPSGPPSRIAAPAEPQAPEAAPENEAQPSEEAVPPAAGRATITKPAQPRAAEVPEASPAKPSESAAPQAAGAPQPPPRPHNWIPYTVRPGDSLGSVANLFGVTAADLARANRMQPDDELLAGAVLKVPNPFTAEVNSLKRQVEQLNGESRQAADKARAADSELRSLRDKVDELGADNQSLNQTLRILPWWRAAALAGTAGAMLMLGVMLVTLFEWWRMRRRYVVLAEMAEALGHLDYKYKAMLGKAELRLQQLYGRRRQGLPEGQPRPKLPEEIEIERLNEELKEFLEEQLVKLGVRPRRPGRWREIFGGVSSPVEAGSERR
ncbi:MAG TPA: LysM peptidoglycan-binding domain-containing protein [Candidatus Binataceae bacterium]|nr:LysM peptidoglycan-binding domain-containing protein [Candidatus Binataceae bacterium]